VTNYVYNDPLKRLTEVANKNSSGEIINRFLYGYEDPVHPDNRTSETVTEINPLTFTVNRTVNYDHNSLNQLIQSTPPEQLFEYDASGNMQHGYTPAGHRFFAKYDAENRLKSIEFTDSDGTIHKNEYVYRGDNMLGRIKRHENGIHVDDERIIRTKLFSLQDRDMNNNIIREYVWGQDLDGGIGGLLSLRQGEDSYSYIYDGKGNVTALITSDQNVAAAYRYDSFGNLMARSGTVDQPFQFSTKRFDTKFGLAYFGYRMYSPVIGKWLTFDPIEEKGGINLYVYVQNNPINLIDPWGQKPLSAGHLDWFAREISVTGGPPPGVDTPPCDTTWLECWDRCRWFTHLAPVPDPCGYTIWYEVVVIYTCATSCALTPCTYDDSFFDNPVWW
jgi:RHS repeat-associated protein